jgi:uncharacterized FAD-dependent dehydrogenase
LFDQRSTPEGKKKFKQKFEQQKKKIKKTDGTRVFVVGVSHDKHSLKNTYAFCFVPKGSVHSENYGSGLVSK